MNMGGLKGKISVFCALAFLVLVVLGMIFIVRDWYYPNPQITPEAASTTVGETPVSDEYTMLDTFKELCEFKGGKYMAYESYNNDFKNPQVEDGIERYPAVKVVKITCTINE
jgi:hypothetical protein